MQAHRSRLVSRVVLFVAACVLAFEEWIWNHASALLRRFGRLPPFRRIEDWVRRRTPLQALVLYLLPLCVVLPLKGIALGVIGHGDVASGFAILFIAKVIGTAVLARVWQLTEPAITTYSWIRRGRDRFLRLRRRLYGWLYQQAVYRNTRALLDRLKRQGGILAELREQLRRQRRERALVTSAAAPTARHLLLTQKSSIRGHREFAATDTVEVRPEWPFL